MLSINPSVWAITAIVCSCYLNDESHAGRWGNHQFILERLYLSIPYVENLCPCGCILFRRLRWEKGWPETPHPDRARQELQPFCPASPRPWRKACVLDCWPCRLALCHSSKLSLSFLTRAASGVQGLCIPGLYPVLPDLCPRMDFTPAPRHALPAVWSPLRMLL